MLKKLMFSILIILLTVAAGCSSGSGSGASQSGSPSANSSTEEKVVLKIGSVSSPESTIGKLVYDPFMKRVTELTNGKVEFEYYPSEQLGKATDMLSLTANGVMDIGYFVNSYFPSEMPIGSQVTGMPGLIASSYEGSMALKEISRKSPMLETDFLNHGVRPVIYITAPPTKIFTTSVEFRSPADLKGVQLRSSGGVLSELLNYAGAVPVQIAGSEAYNALERGVVNGVASSAASADLYGLGELVKFGATNLSIGVNGLGLMINEKTFQKLSKEIQDAIMQASDEVTESASKGYDEEEVGLLAKWQENVNLYELSETDAQEWEKLFDEFNTTWISKQNDVDFQTAVDLLKAEVEKIR